MLQENYSGLDTLSGRSFDFLKCILWFLFCTYWFWIMVRYPIFFLFYDNNWTKHSDRHICFMRHNYFLHFVGGNIHFDTFLFTPTAPPYVCACFKPGDCKSVVVVCCSPSCLFFVYCFYINQTLDLLDWIVLHFIAF